MIKHHLHMLIFAQRVWLLLIRTAFLVLDLGFTILLLRPQVPRLVSISHLISLSFVVHIILILLHIGLSGLCGQEMCLLTRLVTNFGFSLINNPRTAGR
jgi:hypothetical protein